MSVCDKRLRQGFATNSRPQYYVYATIVPGSDLSEQNQAFTPTGVKAISRWFAFKAHHRSDGIECDSILKGSQRLRHAKVAVIPSGSDTGFRCVAGGVASLDPRLLAAILSGSTPRTPFRISGSTQEPCRTFTSHRTNRNLEQKMNGNFIQKTLKLLFVAQPRLCLASQ